MREATLMQCVACHKDLEFTVGDDPDYHAMLCMPCLVRLETFCERKIVDIVFSHERKRGRVRYWKAGGIASSINSAIAQMRCPQCEGLHG
jgi:hypothetical protein